MILVGCGRNGTLLAWQLAGLGVSRLTLVDGDLLGLENLDAMPGLTAADVGRPKVEALGERLVAFRPDISVRCFSQPVTDVLDRLQMRADLMVTCVDDDAPRWATSWLSRETLTPHLDVGTSVQREGDNPLQITADVRFLLPFAGSVACVGGLSDPEHCLYELAAPPGSLHRDTPAVWTVQRAGSLITINSQATATACQTWLDYLTGTVRSSQWHRLAWSVGIGLTVTRGGVGAGLGCHFCTMK